MSRTEPQRRMRRRTWCAVGWGAVLMGLSVTGCSTASDTVRLDFTTYLGPSSPVSQAVEEIVAQVSDDSGGRIEIEIYYEGALLSATDGLAGIADGRADLGYIGPNYTPSELPLSQVQSVPFVSGDSAQANAAFTRLLDDNEALQEEFASSGVQPLAVGVSTDNLLATAEPVTGLAALQGLSLRATGPVANAIDAAGANAVALPIGEVYESVERGLISGYSSMSFENILAFSLHEVAPHVADIGSGPYLAPFVVMNQGVWDGLDADDQALLTEAFRQMHAKTADVTESIEEETCTVILNGGGSVRVWSERERESWRAAVGDSILDEWKDAVDGSGGDAEAFYAAFLEALDSVETDREDTGNGMERCAAR